MLVSKHLKTPKFIAQHQKDAGLLPTTGVNPSKRGSSASALATKIVDALDPELQVAQDDTCALWQLQAQQLSGLQLQLQDREMEVRQLQVELTAAWEAVHQAQHEVDQSEQHWEQLESEMRMLQAMNGMMGMGRGMAGFLTGLLMGQSQFTQHPQTNHYANESTGHKQHAHSASSLIVQADL